MHFLILLKKFNTSLYCNSVLPYFKFALKLLKYYFKFALIIFDFNFTILPVWAASNDTCLFKST